MRAWKNTKLVEMKRALTISSFETRFKEGRI